MRHEGRRTLLRSTFLAVTLPSVDALALSTGQRADGRMEAGAAAVQLGPGVGLS